MEIVDAVLKTSLVPVFIVDESGEIVASNEEFVDFFGEVGGKTGMVDVFGDSIVEIHSEILKKGCGEFEYPVETGGKYRRVRFKGTLLENLGLVVYSMGGCKTLFSELERYVIFYEFLLELTGFTLLRGWSEETLREILRTAVSKFPKAQAGSVVVREGDSYRYIALEGYDLEKLGVLRFSKEVIEEFAKEPHIVHWRDRMESREIDEHTEKLLREYGRADEIESTLVLPITLGDDVEGYITLDNFDSKDAFDSIDLELARIFQNHVRILLQKHEMEKELSYLASHDPLTGVLNRRIFRKRVEKEMKRSKRNGRSFGIVYLDLDDFKSVNDIHGHACGDDVLRTVANALLSNTRETDEIGRLGGDEFVVLLPETDESGVERFMWRMGEVFGKLVVVCDSSTVQVRASFGHAVYPGDGENFETLLKVADSRMYGKKRWYGESGRGE